jgi:eukaryotic-like serine/threonine-protein kinase
MSHPVVMSDVTHASTVTGVATMRGPRELTRGTSLGRFVVLEPIGSGGHGNVYAADDFLLKRRVALKILRDGHGPVDPEARRERLLNEARAAARLSHPNVVTVHDVGIVADMVFIAMELVEGDTLRGWLKARPRSQREIIDVFLQAGRGLSAAHAADLVHRDFKPANVLIDRAGPSWRARTARSESSRSPARRATWRPSNVAGRW